MGYKRTATCQVCSPLSTHISKLGSFNMYFLALVLLSSAVQGEPVLGYPDKAVNCPGNAALVSALGKIPQVASFCSSIIPIAPVTKTSQLLG